MTPDRLEQIRARTERLAAFGVLGLTGRDLDIAELLVEVERLTAELERLTAVGICGDRIAERDGTTADEVVAGTDATVTALRVTNDRGWTTLPLAQPVQVKAGETYLVSYGEFRSAEEIVRAAGWLPPGDAKEMRADVAQLQAVVEHLTAQLRQKEAERAAVALERDELINDRDVLTGHDWWPRREQDQAREGIAPVVVAESCTGVGARWCPIHGQCTCPPGDYADLNDPGCPLHAQESDHA